VPDNPIAPIGERKKRGLRRSVTDPGTERFPLQEGAKQPTISVLETWQTSSFLIRPNENRKQGYRTRNRSCHLIIRAAFYQENISRLKSSFISGCGLPIIEDKERSLPSECIPKERKKR
jgi:hypothetical protein